MKLKSYDEMRKLNRKNKERRAVKWCINLLYLDIDTLPNEDVEEIRGAYEYVVRVPEAEGFSMGIQRFVTYKSKGKPSSIDYEGAFDQYKERLKGYQKIAKDFLGELEEMNLKGKGCSLDRKPKSFLTLKLTGNDNVFQFDRHDEDDFEYSLAWHLARFLDGKKFEDAIKKCPVCGHYFPALSQHGKKYCSHKCSMSKYQKEKRQENPELAKRRQKIQTYLSSLKKNDTHYSKKRIQQFLNTYIKKDNYTEEEIPNNIQKFLGEDQ